MVLAFSHGPARQEIAELRKNSRFAVTDDTHTVWTIEDIRATALHTTLQTATPVDTPERFARAHEASQQLFARRLRSG